MRLLFGGDDWGHRNRILVIYFFLLIFFWFRIFSQFFFFDCFLIIFLIFLIFHFIFFAFSFFLFFLFDFFCFFVFGSVVLSALLRESGYCCARPAGAGWSGESGGCRWHCWHCEVRCCLRTRRRQALRKAGQLVRWAAGSQVAWSSGTPRHFTK